MKLKLTSVLSLLFLFVSAANAQFTGYTAELDTIFFGADTPTPDDPLDPDGNLEFYGTYKIYANFTNSTDVISALYSDVTALQTPFMYIDAPCGCHNPVAGSSIMDATNSSALWMGPFMDWEYDTYWTIGMESSDDEGNLPQSIGTPPNGSGICSDVMDNVTLFSLGATSNSIAGDDLKVLIAQVTTCGHFSLSACIQVFVEGEQSDVQYSCPDPLEVTHIYEDGECVNDADGDGICDEFEIIGCMDVAACNYDPEATDDTGECDYTCYGCTDEGACNYDDQAMMDDGSCEYISCGGCNDPTACNYNPDAQLNDGSCEYSSCSGCTDPNACNFDFEATLDDGTCDFTSCLGCTFSWACNYDEQALIDDESCIFPGDSCDDEEAFTFDDFIQDDCSCLGYGCHDEEACNYFPNSLPSNSSCNYVAVYGIIGPTNPNAQTLLTYTYPYTSGSTYEWETYLGDVEDGEGTASVEVAWWGDGIGTICVTETNSAGCSGEQECLNVEIVPVSIDDLEGGSAVLIYPSPANTQFTVSSVANAFNNAEVVLRDMSGRVIRTAILNQHVTMDVSDLSSGTYLVQINSEAQNSLYRRILIE